MSLDLALTIARSGLAAVQRQLSVASQNVANANTEGYTRKSLAQTAITVADMPAGLRTSEQQRNVDTALVNRMQSAGAAAAAAAVRETLLTGIEQAHGATGAGDSLAEAVSGLQSAFIALRATPADAGQQRSALDAATTLADRLNAISTAIGTARQQAQDGLVAEVDGANAALREVADLTLRIRSGGEGDQAALEDRRDQVLARLAESLDVTVLRKSDGDITVVARGGIILPLDPKHDVLSIGQATVAPDAYYGGGGTLPGVMLNGIDITGQIKGGRVGEYLNLRDDILPRFQAETDLTAATLAERFAAQGLKLFTDADGTSVPATGTAYASGSQLGFAGRIRVNPEVAATPGLLRDGTDAVSGSPLGAADFTPNPPGGPASFTTLLDRVLDFTFTGNAAAGVTWPPISGSGLGPDGSLASPFAAPASIGGYADRVTSAQTSERALASQARENATALQSSLLSRFDAQSGVDVDAEMSGLVQLQNSYAANARVVSTLQGMWETLLGAVR
ncbi:flagellar basal body protein [Siccirubricoccus sp. KC 17139]|uniref:Flagellar hook-associated protein 1 n=1 Tax=Siccirubricoccus soli TaxID=2899147 RepID=A0ABT1D4Y9_9PROT|nr:flagellar basal body rod C-terminal domain-containing protein [Siccirubricoccus soli]MCO6416990.1 flagellar basal body protein [Siccirubricoccus soli]MCP2683125.1 flagellar basal body protein [Siccirubricoccus soli]